MVVEDNFKDVRFTPIMQPMWHYLHHRSFTGIHRKLYVYFHDKKLDVSVSRRTVSNSSTRLMPSMPRMPSISFSMYGSS